MSVHLVRSLCVRMSETIPCHQLVDRYLIRTELPPQRIGIDQQHHQNENSHLASVRYYRQILQEDICDGNPNPLPYGFWHMP